MKAVLPIFALFLGLSACAPAPAPAPVFDPSVDVTPGLNDKEPDTCHAARYRFFVGKPPAELQAVLDGKPMVVMGPGSLGSQEYSSARINAFVDEAGMIYRLSCG